jgi:hypothetical protein
MLSPGFHCPLIPVDNLVLAMRPADDAAETARAVVATTLGLRRCGAAPLHLRDGACDNEAGDVNLCQSIVFMVTIQRMDFAPQPQGFDPPHEFGRFRSEPAAGLPGHHG